jgi:radical SAM superfamily enzyme YgiQ (UPF0313 family)
VKINLLATQQISVSNPVSLRNCLGVLQLAASLEQYDFNCHVFDFEELNNLYNYDFEETMEKVVGKIISAAPDILGLSTMSNNLATAVDICERVKKKNAGVITVLGGPGVSFCAQEILMAFPWIDTVVRGEADDAFPLYVQALASKIKNPKIAGLVYHSGEKIVDNGWAKPIENLDELPIPAYEFCKDNINENEETSLFGDYNGVSLEAGRGCPFNCTFCSTSHFFKKKHRLKSVQRIIDEILYTREKLGNQRIIFTHDIMTLRRDYMEQLCREIQRQVPGLVWKCHARFDSTDKKLLENMRQAGCNEIFYGIETTTPRMQEILKKRLDLTGFNEKIKYLKDLDFRFSLSFIVGVPGEEPQDIDSVLNHALRAKSLAGRRVFIKIHTLVPVPGSELYENWKDQLVYDDYGSPGTSDIPVHWEKLRTMIQRHPGIFSLYYHFPIGDTGRNRSNKYSMLGTVLDSLMQFSMKYAYMILGEGLPSELVRRIDQIQLPPPAAFKNIEYHILCLSIRELILELLESNPISAGKFDTLAQFETAAQQVFKQKKTGFFKIIETVYDPQELLDEIKAGKITTEDPPGDKQLYFMILWDEKESKLKCTQIPQEFALIASGSQEGSFLPKVPDAGYRCRWSYQKHPQ